MQTLSNLQLLQLQEINPKLSAAQFYFLSDIATSKTVAYGFIDLAKKRIDTLNKHFAAAGKANLSIISDPKMFCFKWQISTEKNNTLCEPHGYWLAEHRNKMRMILVSYKH